MKRPRNSPPTRFVQDRSIVPITKRVERIDYIGNLSTGSRNQPWEHPAVKGTELEGLPKGTIIKTPDGKTVKLRANSVLIRNRKGKPTWGRYAKNPTKRVKR